MPKFKFEDNEGESRVLSFSDRDGDTLCVHHWPTLGSRERNTVIIDVNNHGVGLKRKQARKLALAILAEVDD